MHVSKQDVQRSMIEKMPSGISAAMTAISASNHKQYLTIIGYSALHNSDRCFPERLSNQKNICMLVKIIIIIIIFIYHSQIVC